MSNDCCKQRKQATASSLSPRWIRLTVYVVLILIAVAAILLIDRRAMQRQTELEQQHLSAKPTTDIIP